MVTMRPILFSLGGLNFYSYGFFTAIAFLISGFIVDRLAKRKHLTKGRGINLVLLDNLLLSLVIAIVSARISYIGLYALIFRTESLDSTTNWLGGGFIFYAGLVAGLSCFHYLLKRIGDLNGVWFDILSLAILAGLSISEVGGYLNDGAYLHLIRIAGTSALAGLSYYFLLTNKTAGKTFGLSFLSLYIFYFFLGFWQLEKINWLSLNLGQWASLVGIIGSYHYVAKLAKT